MEKILIPKRCKVGFNERADTFTKMLGYVIMHDGKKWRKEDSWEKWREKYMTDEEFQAKKLVKFNDDRNYKIQIFDKYINHQQNNAGSAWEQRDVAKYSELGLDAYLKENPWEEDANFGWKRIMKRISQDKK